MKIPGQCDLLNDSARKRCKRFLASFDLCPFDLPLIVIERHLVVRLSSSNALLFSTHDESLLGAIVLFIIEWLPIDVTAIAIMVTLMVPKPWTHISMGEGISGFTNSPTITVLAMLIYSYDRILFSEKYLQA